VVVVLLVEVVVAGIDVFEVEVVLVVGQTGHVSGVSGMEKDPRLLCACVDSRRGCCGAIAVAKTVCHVGYHGWSTGQKHGSLIVVVVFVEVVEVVEVVVVVVVLLEVVVVLVLVVELVDDVVVVVVVDVVVVEVYMQKIFSIHQWPLSSVSAGHNSTVVVVVLV
jgi:hypothetical protein